MSTPAQVARAAEEATRRQTELNTPPADPAAPPADPAAPPADPAPAAAPSDEIERMRAELAKAEQRYRSLQGHHEAERQRMLDRIDRMAQLLENAATAPAAPAAPAAPQSLATAQDVETFGQDTIDFVTRICRGVVAELRPQLEMMVTQHTQPVVQQVAAVQKSAEQLAYEQLVNALQRAVPDWETINTDQRFWDWLNTVDPMVGVPYQTLLNDARQRYDAPRAIAIFQRYKEIAGLNKPAPAQPAVDERQALVEPARRAGATARPAGGAEKPRYTRASIAQFYRDVASGKISKAEASAKEADILLAQSEGRIVG